MCIARVPPIHIINCCDRYEISSGGRRTAAGRNVFGTVTQLGWKKLILMAESTGTC